LLVARARSGLFLPHLVFDLYSILLLLYCYRTTQFKCFVESTSSKTAKSKIGVLLLVNRKTIVEKRVSQVDHKDQMISMMEEDLLQEMIRDRELSITFIKKKISDQDEKDIRLRKQQILITETVATNRDEYRTELTALRQKYGEYLRQYHDMKDALDTKRQHQQQNNGGTTTPKVPGLHVYNEIMNAVDTNASSSSAAAAMAGIESSSNYVVRMQSQLCKAMHGMGIMETQLQLTRKQTELYKKKSKDSITDMVEEKSQVELKIVNELIIADTSRQEVEMKRKTQHDSFFKEKYDLLEKIERQNEHAAAAKDDDDDDNNDEEEDNPEDKEELTGMLEHGKEEIERLLLSNEETAKTLEELKIKAAIAQGQDVVDDIVTSIAEEFAEQEEDDDSDDDYN
jgi:hypothetical protein